MANRNDNFDDDEGFFKSIMKKNREEVSMPESMSRLLKIIIGVAVLGVISIITWVAWPNSQLPLEDNVPIVRADTTDYKVIPEDKGGMPIPNKESTIFEAMDTATPVPKKIESLLEDSEQPLDKKEVFAEQITAEEITPEPEIIVEKKDAPVTIIKEEIVIEKNIEPVVPVKPAPPIVEKKKIDIIDALKEEAGTKKEEIVKPKPVGKGNAYIQLASVKSDADAKTKWAQLKSSYASLKPLTLRVQKADLGAKGIFYRVQAGPMSGDSAVSTCSKIKSAGGGCLVVK